MSMAIACSAVVVALPLGVLTTITPRSVAVVQSILSTPIPALPIIFSLFTAAKTSFVTLVEERMMSASVSCSSLIKSSGLRFVL